MNFIESLEVGTNKNTKTANGAVSNDSSLDDVLDFFSKAGSMRGDERSAKQLFDKAYAQDKELALKALFYIRDIRGGQGERSIFKYIFSTLSDDVKLKLSSFVPEYGRWDDIDFNENTINIISKQLDKDLKELESEGNVSLLSKWLPSANSKNYKTRKEGQKVAKLLNMKESKYRKTLSKLRAYIDILEKNMSSKLWSDIDYSRIPSVAHKKHVKAFLRNDETRYREFISKVEKGEEKINSGTLFTYDIYDMVKNNYNKDQLRTANALWNGLPDYTNGENALVMADTSGSMYGRPISVSVSLAVYFAERNKGVFKNKFLTFSAVPKLQSVVGSTIDEKFSNLNRAEWGMNTNLESAFDSILSAAIDSNASQDEIPSVLYIISDMQFDSCVYDGNNTNFNVARNKFESNGYKLPHVVFWNVNGSYGNDSPATKFDKNCTLISGFSQSTFQYAVAGKTPIESMKDILLSPRYEKISV